MSKDEVRCKKHVGSHLHKRTLYKAAALSRDTVTDTDGRVRLNTGDEHWEEEDGIAVCDVGGV